MTRRLARVLAAVAACVAATPMTTSAQEVATDQPPPGTIVLGPMTIAPGLVVKEIGVDDNVFNESDDPKSDFTFTVTPRANVGFQIRRVRLGYIATAEYVYYQAYDSERGTNLTSEARVDGDFGRLRPYASVVGANTRNRINPEVDARARHHDLTYAAGASVRAASRTSVLLNVRHGTIEYEPDTSFRGVSLQDSFNGELDRVEGGLGVDLTPITTFSVLGQRERQRFDLSPARDSESWRVAPTVTFSPTGLLTGSASVGYRHFDALDPSLPDYSGFVASASIGATIYGRHQLQAAYQRDVQYSYDPSTPYYLANGGNVMWTTIIARPFDVRGTVARNLMDYRGAGSEAGNDTATAYGGGVGFRLSDHARIGVNVEWVQRHSERSADREYRNRRLFASLTWGAV